jgi:hypothetical protein
VRPQAANCRNPIGYRTGMDSPRERVCPSCSAPTAEARQRWCLECGAELPSQRRGGLRPAIGVATTLALLVGAASAGGYTLLQDGKQPPPPATTVAQQPVATPPATTPPATQEPLTPAPSTPTPLPSTPAPSTPKTPLPPPAPSSSGHVGQTGDNGGGTDTTTTDTTPQAPQLALTDIALGAAAVAYAPYAPQDADLGDPSRVVDGSTRTVWRTPAALTSPGVNPQLGIYLDLADKQKIRKLVLQTPTPGMSVEIYGAASGPPETITDPGWDHLATREKIASKTTIGLPQQPFRYILVWITGLPAGADSAAISEVSLLSLQPE